MALIAISFMVATLVFDILEYYTRRHAFLLEIRQRSMAFGILASLMLITALYMFQTEPRPFVYFQF